MKKLAAYYLLLFYAASLAKPLAVWFADLMAHAYTAHQHLTVVHRDAGRNHVHYQMNKAAKDEAPEQKTATAKENEDVTVAAFVEVPVRSENFVLTKYSSSKPIQLPAILLTVQSPPPWASVA